MDSSKTNLIKVDYSEIINPNSNLSKQISEAFGLEGLGLIAIKNIPGYPEIRKRILTQGFKMAHFSQDDLKSLEKPETNYSLGWQKGNTYINGQWEALTGSFHARVLNETITHSNDELKNKYLNTWPSEEQLSGFKKVFSEMGLLLTNCVENLLYHLDRYTKECNSDYEEFNLYNKLRTRNDVLSRLIIYYPANTYDEEKYGKESKDNWCAWHRDFGVLTGLAHPVYFKESGEIVEGIGSGLIVKDRKKELHNITYGEDEIVIQSGDISFIMTGGCVISTPHCVKITEDMPKDVYRITFVNFYDPCFEEMIDLPNGIDREELSEKDPLGMKYMVTKFNGPVTYQEFVGEAFNNYYAPIPDKK
jgi:isopenicillin N synthase-like dioxygenase